MITRQQMQEFEDTFYAPYAMKSAASRGRTYAESEHPYRTAYQRDRDRIVHSAAFRRLEYKTQVFVIHEGDYYRTRLTHTLEVAQIARTISGALRLNLDLTEALALAHDLGHTPFGHAGEDALNELMADSGGFNHNEHGLRVVDVLEERYPEFPGLNLSWEVREGIIKHSTPFDRPVKLTGFAPDESASLETQVVDIADEIAYDNHDLDDGITCGLLQEEELAELPLWSDISQDIRQHYPAIDAQRRKYLMIRSLINLQVTDLIRQTETVIQAEGLTDAMDATRLKKRTVGFSPAMVNLRKPLREFLMTHMYHHYRVMRMSCKARRFISEMFRVYVKNPDQLPPQMQRRILTEGPARVVCDYIAGMTDRYALDEYKKLFDPYEKV